MAREQLTTRVSPDLHEAFEQFAEEEGISKSEAMRRCLRDSLDARGYYENGVDRGILSSLL
jgi:predicted transcriptional regulator